MFAPGNAWSPTQAFQEEEILLVTLPQQRITSLRMSTFPKLIELSDTN